jgi:hypothetical protein
MNTSKVQDLIIYDLSSRIEINAETVVEKYLALINWKVKSSVSRGESTFSIDIECVNKQILEYVLFRLEGIIMRNNYTFRKYKTIAGFVCIEITR